MGVGVGVRVRVLGVWGCGFELVCNVCDGVLVRSVCWVSVLVCNVWVSVLVCHADHKTYTNTLHSSQNIKPGFIQWAEVSLVDGINQTSQSERPCTTTRSIKKESCLTAAATTDT